ncbi:hypothetical protein [Listeria cornellensis]|uniref:Uncharacterized protein n=1 Tax=Listeria cornellensis FSL F6-0969 TaxID=1265820 RepID=W7BXI7_9LIST|nr:hypothetical protein [Listeria cornellensis]EUJ31589.1 hypothetical protein PCORN_04592 [Listeria cornellensis FSL F6-0969]
MKRLYASKLNLVMLTVMWALLLVLNLINYVNTKSELILVVVIVAVVGLVLNFVFYFVASRKR